MKRTLQNPRQMECLFASPDHEKDCRIEQSHNQSAFDGFILM